MVPLWLSQLFSSNRTRGVLLLISVYYGPLRLLRIWRRQIQESRRCDYFADKTVLLTGASSGIGWQLAQRLHRFNARLILACRSVDKLKALCSKLMALNPSHHPPVIHYLDLGDPNHLGDFVSKVAATLGNSPLDVIIHNAGIGLRASCAETEMVVLRRLMEVNYFGPAALTNALLPMMSSSDGGTLAVVSSLQVFYAKAFRSAYGAAKQALQTHFDCLRLELAASGSKINVFTFSPSYVNTDLGSNALNGSGEPCGEQGVLVRMRQDAISPEETAVQFLDGIVMGRHEVVCAPFTHKIFGAYRVILPELHFRILARLAKQELVERSKL